MDHYHIWFDLKEPHKDLEFVRALEAFLDRLRVDGRIESYQLMRRKLGFGPAEVGEFFLDISVRDLAQLDAAFGAVAPRVGAIEEEHARVWGRVTNFRSGLWRDFPDPVRARGTKEE